MHEEYPGPIWACRGLPLIPTLQLYDGVRGRGGGGVKVENEQRNLDRTDWNKDGGLLKTEIELVMRWLKSLRVWRE